MLPVLLTLTLLLTGCYASLKHSPAVDGGTGIRYYRAAPYLLVHSDAKGGLLWRIVYLPDQSQKMMAEPIVFGGRSEMTLQFRNGVLVGASELGDTTEVPKAIIAAVQSALPLIAGALDAPKALEHTDTLPAPHLYKIVVTGDQVQFLGGAGDAPIVVTLGRPS
jgi:hypothetical protein